ncbi:hypothetical protein EVAR_16810_1 [Eumeta japonica]|uniref:Uncharacterized protein n=1 Tax=Eumeta variegata TaxID=151549 RepID=A0A4C1V1H3_EUMVA|nr:hypothetical protein EVAR_16810_1 [Eumeta japonica]
MLHELQLRHFVVEAKLAIKRVAKLPFPRSPAACDPQARGPRRRHNAIIQLNMEDSTFHIDYDDCEPIIALATDLRNTIMSKLFVEGVTGHDTHNERTEMQRRIRYSLSGVLGGLTAPCSFDKKAGAVWES